MQGIKFQKQIFCLPTFQICLNLKVMQNFISGFLMVGCKELAICDDDINLSRSKHGHLKAYRPLKANLIPKTGL